ncbi:MAG TPA: DUF2863 family protein [Telluria sp.]|nr:DUF2863 family protein [Telluria sp.]
MPKNKRPVPRSTSKPAEDDEELQAQALAELALAIAEREDADPEVLRTQETEFSRLLRNALRKKNDDLLYGAIERARDTDVGAYQYLRAQVEEASATLLLRRDGAPTMEINAFVVPLFVHSSGGLREDQAFEDGAAFEQLVASIGEAGLESPQAKVVLISHAYDLGEIDAISYSHLHDMVRDAAASMTEKKIVATPALERSIAGWAPSAFAPGDSAMELRFLLGFALKRADDAFYQVPDDEAGADAYFASRMERYRRWTEQAGPLVRRCLAADPASIELSFLYQDLFYGGKEQGMAEFAMLAMMAEMNHALELHALEAGQVRAVVAPADVAGQMVLRVNLVAAQGGALLGSSEKPLDLAADLQTEVDDICDALATIGIAEVAVAMRFDQDGAPVDPRRYPPG